jgi:two-component system, sensor histidine kinase SagS
MSQGTAMLKLLLLAGSSDRTSSLVDTLRGSHEVIVAHTMEEALAELRGGMVDAVVSEAADFLPLERALASQQSGLILDTIGEGICISDSEGKILWSNRRMRQWPEAVRERIQKTCHEAWKMFTTQMGPLDPTQSQYAGALVGGGAGETPQPLASPGRSRKFSFDINDAQFFEMFCSPVVDSKKQVSQVVAICWDSTGGRRLQQKIDAIDMAGQELVRLEGEAISRLTVGQRLKLLEEKVIKFCRQLMHFDHFAIRLLDRKTNKLELVMCVGMPTEAMEVELFAVPEGNGISGWVASSKRSYICADVSKDPRYVAGLSHARSSLTVPLLLQGKVVGIFNIESQQPAAFTEDDRQFAEIFGRYVAVALNILNLLVVERHVAAGQLATDVNQEVAGPLNDIETETTMLMEDYIGNDEMRKRLQSILDDVAKIRKSVKEVGGPKTLLGDPNAATKADPALAGKRILVADDEAAIRQTIADLLTRHGCKVTQAKDGAEAIGFLASQPAFDLVLSDIKMPKKNGYEIFAAAQKLGHKAPVILMTGFGYDPSHSIVRASQEGLAAVLFKPFKVDQLMEEVKKAVMARGSK